MVIHNVLVRNLYAAQLAAFMADGPGQARLLIRGLSVTLLSFSIPLPIFLPPVEGKMQIAGLPLLATALQTGLADNAQLVSRSDEVAASYSVTGIGGGGDIEISSISVIAGRPARLADFTYSAPP